MSHHTSCIPPRMVRVGITEAARAVCALRHTELNLIEEVTKNCLKQVFNPASGSDKARS
jgi:hypothetical protein